MAKAFISFLGTGDYTKCRYAFNQEVGDVVKYVQEDVISRFCKDWSTEDEIRIFTTDDAKKLNWDDNGHNERGSEEKRKINQGLGKCLENMRLTASVKRYGIPVGNSEDEIWQIFQRIYDSLKENDEIIFDITHSFRSIPMLFMVLVGYARLTKNISVKAIYYGAFEILGRPSDVEKNIPEDERIAPVFDLTSFEKLIEWTEATHSFVKNGSASELASLANTDIGLVMKKSCGKEEKNAAQDIGSIVRDINNISQNIMLNRGAELINKCDYARLKENIKNIENSDIFIKPLAPLMKVIEKKIEGFVKDDVKSGFKAVEWCVEHGLYQQAITMFQENMVTFILSEEGLDWGIKDNRDAASDAIKLIADKKAVFKEQRYDSPESAEKVRNLMNNPLLIEFASDLESLRSIRNDINHGGYLTEKNNTAKSAKSIIDNFKSISSKIFIRI
ncbi:MAG: TIGR02221 family CRISPR-associated protein [Desulfamplus sp.]|nr:TIGR02221 family CRISPR-associated protein [Desulfamplus sp.]